jgi:uncharacterized protein (TIGR03437 family)
VSLLRPALARAAATLIRQPYLQNVQRDRASILWSTLEPGDGAVVIGLPDGTTFTVPARARAFTPALTNLSYPFYQYETDVIGLQPATAYAYRITLNGATLTSRPGFFSTAAPGPFSFLVFGDSGEDTSQQKALIPLMGAEPGVSFLLHTGDLAYPQGSFALYDSNYFGLNASLFGRLPTFATPGNHDYMADSAAPFLASQVAPQSGVDAADVGRYYSFDWGDAHFTSIDSNLLPAASVDRMLGWLDNDLRSTRNFWKIVFLHHPPYPTGQHLGDPICATVRARVNPILERNGVQLVLAGHEHGYERSLPLAADQAVPAGLGTTYVITGGGGADLHAVNAGGQTAIALSAYNYLRVSIDGMTLTVRATGIDGSEIERFVLRPQPVIAQRGVLSVGDYSAALARGSLASIFGQNLALRPQAASDDQTAAGLGGARVQFNNQDIPVLYVSPKQINVQIPYDAAPAGTLQVLTDNGAAQADISIFPSAPSILAVTVANAPASGSNAPSPGSAVVVYATGLGSGNVTVWLGDRSIQPSFAGPTNQFAGLYQVNFTVPDSLAAGPYALRIATPNASSRSVPVVIQGSGGTD